MTSPRPPRSYPDNPVLVRFLRGREVESVHRGAWCLVDTTGEVLAGAGELRHAYFARSSVKALQALALLESGAAERYQLSDEELALVIASHAGEACHTVADLDGPLLLARDRELALRCDGSLVHPAPRALWG